MRACVLGEKRGAQKGGSVSASANRCLHTGQ